MFLVWYISIVASSVATHDVIERLQLELDMDKLHTIFNHSQPLRPIRNSDFTWAQVNALLTAAGHSWCSLSRDNWACVGERYYTVLKQTPTYNPQLRLGAFPRGTRIFIEGNSHLAEMLDTIICNSHSVVWNIDGIETNSLLAVDFAGDVALLMLDNDEHWTHHHNRTSNMLHRASFLTSKQTIIVLGDLNNYLCSSCKSEAHLRTAAWNRSFPDAAVLTYDGSLLPSGCEADFHNCKNSVHGHTCFPGPIIQVAETMVRNMLKAIKLT